MNFLKRTKFTITSSAILGSLYLFNNKRKLYSNTLPTFTRKEVGQHRDKETRIWIAYKDGVYDITDFIPNHPGGEQKIMMGAGGALEPFWAMYAFHKKDGIEDILEKYRIGNLDPKEIMDPKDIPNFDGLKVEKINRSELLKIHHKFPYCAEAPKEVIDYYYTPEDLFFVRNHNQIPDLDIQNYKLKIKLGDKKLKLSLDDLHKMEQTTIDSIIMCTGNRRKHMNIETNNKTKGIEWETGAIANIKWTGVLLRDILIQNGYTKEKCKGLHLISTGYDKDFQGVHFSVSVPLEMVFETDVLLALKYNHKDIPFEHGYPIRLVIPGVVGVRNTKWLKYLEISNQECQSSFQQKDYKLIPKDQDWEKADFSKYSPLYYLTLNSAIVKPRSGDTISEDKVNIKGWAMGYKGARIKKIELSFDEGKSWQEVDVLKYNQIKEKAYGWTLWECEKQLNEGINNIWVRAEDEDGNTQPITSDNLWNYRGLMNNAIHKININKI